MKRVKNMEMLRFLLVLCSYLKHICLLLLVNDEAKHESVSTEALQLCCQQGHVEVTALTFYTAALLSDFMNQSLCKQKHKNKRGGGVRKAVILQIILCVRAKVQVFS